MRAIIAVLVSMVLGLLASCSGGVQTDLVDDVRQVSDTTDGPTTSPDYIFYNSEDDELE